MTATTQDDAALIAHPDSYLNGAPHEAFARLRARGAVHWVEEPAIDFLPPGPGFWAVVSHAETEMVLRRPKVFSSSLGLTQIYDAPPPLLPPLRRMMINMDPPEHSRLRRLLSQSFTARAVAKLEERIRETATRLVAAAPADGCDFARDIAADLPLVTLAEILGIPESDRWLAFDWSNRVIGMLDVEYNASDAFDAGAATEMARRALEVRPEPDEHGRMPDSRRPEGMADLYAYARELGAYRRENPGDDVMSLLMQQVDSEGGPVTLDEFEKLFWLFTVAGNETVRNALPGGAVRRGHHRPADPARWRTVAVPARGGDRHRGLRVGDRYRGDGDPAVGEPVAAATGWRDPHHRPSRVGRPGRRTLRQELRSTAGRRRAGHGRGAGETGRRDPTGDPTRVMTSDVTGGTAVIVLTSTALIPGTTRHTGAYASEVVEAWHVFHAAGMAVDLVSVAGGPAVLEAVDERDEIQSALFADPRMAARLAATTPAARVRAGSYDVVFLAGGHGAIYDLPYAEPVAQLVSGAYGAGAVVAAVCHGAAGLLGAKAGDSRPLVAGRRVTAFSTAEEKAVGMAGVVPFFLADELAAAGAEVTTAPAFLPHLVVDGRLITGQNPASTIDVATASTTAVSASGSR